MHVLKFVLSFSAQKSNVYFYYKENVSAPELVLVATSITGKVNTVLLKTLKINGALGPGRG